MKRSCVVLALALTTVSGTSAQVRPADVKPTEEDQAIRGVLATFYEGWNAHDLDKMVSVHAEDVDVINVFGQWHKGKAAIRNDLALVHAGPGRDSQRAHVVEKIRWLGTGIAAVQVSGSQVSSQGQVGSTLGK
jgi:uncharacterized protein (TIGR02246 family)